VDTLPAEDRLASVRQTGRTIGIAVFGSLMAAFTAVCSIQICLQVWSPRVVPLHVGCSAGTLQLIEAIEAARVASADEAEEHAALAKFRGALSPAWTFRPALNGACAGDTAAVGRLHAVDRLRYAEEHAVRYGAVDLAKRRQEVQRFIPLLQHSAERAL
jgi:hypothetical protein